MADTARRGAAEMRGRNEQFEMPAIPEAERVSVETRHAVSYVMTSDGPVIIPGQVITEDVDTTPPPGGQIPEETPALLPPANKDVPYVSGVGEVGQTLHCTMGNWTGEPSLYAYQWQSDGANVGTDNNGYVVAAEDSGHSIACVVTASNANGATAAPPSNTVVIA